MGVSGAVGSSAGFSAFVLAAILRHVNIPMGNNDGTKEGSMNQMLKIVRRVKLLVTSTMNLLIQGAEASAATAALLAQTHNRLLDHKG